MSQSQNNPNWSTQRKYVVVTLDQTGNSGGGRVCPVFQGLLAREKKPDCMPVCLPQAYFPICLKIDFKVLPTILDMFNVHRAFCESFYL